jgi:hypothetical protein
VAQWAINNQYHRDDLVIYQATTYIARQDNFSSAIANPTRLDLWAPYTEPAFTLSISLEVANIGQTSTLTGNVTGFSGNDSWILKILDQATGQQQSPSAPILLPAVFDPQPSTATQSPTWVVKAARPGTAGFTLTVSGMGYYVSCACWKPTTLTATLPGWTISAGAPIVTVTQNSEGDCNGNVATPLKFSWTNGGYAYCQYRVVLEPLDNVGNCCVTPGTTVAIVSGSTMSYTNSDKTKNGLWLVTGLCPGLESPAATGAFGTFAPPPTCP